MLRQLRLVPVLALVMMLWPLTADAAWTIRRDPTNPYATATAGGDNDTLANLALHVGISATEMTRAIKHGNGNVVDHTVRGWRTNPVRKGATYTVPNQVIQVWLGDGAWFGKRYMFWNTNRNHYNALGYQVVVLATSHRNQLQVNSRCRARYCNWKFDRATSGRIAQYFIANVQSGKIAGLHVMGHGGEESFGSSKINTWLSYKDYYEGAVKLPYANIQACNGNWWSGLDVQVVHNDHHKALRGYTGRNRLNAAYVTNGNVFRWRDNTHARSGRDISGAKTTKWRAVAGSIYAPLNASVTTQDTAYDTWDQIAAPYALNDNAIIFASSDFYRPGLAASEWRRASSSIAAGDLGTKR